MEGSAIALILQPRKVGGAEVEFQTEQLDTLWLSPIRGLETKGKSVELWSGSHHSQKQIKPRFTISPSLYPSFLFLVPFDAVAVEMIVAALTLQLRGRQRGRNTIPEWPVHTAVKPSRKEQIYRHTLPQLLLLHNGKIWQWQLINLKFYSVADSHWFQGGNTGNSQARSHITCNLSPWEWNHEKVGLVTEMITTFSGNIGNFPWPKPHHLIEI